jgi:steroid delta-isomerase-like uncharacterized protein
MNNKTIISTFIEQAFNLGNTNIIGELVHPDYRYTSPSDQLDGPDELAAFVAAFREAFPDLRADITDQLEDEKTVCTRLTVKGTQLGSFLDIPATGRSIEIEGVVISRFKDGLIHEEWELLDHYKFLTQLGVMEHLD